MSLLIGKKNSVAYHLATEEYLLKHYDLQEDILYLWYGSKAFVFGRNQNPFIEIAPKYLLNPDIPKYRRLSGGGTIYQDQGTLNFTYITKDYKHKINDYKYFLDPIIDYLKSLGLNAYFKPKSHLFVDEAKVSGNAQAFVNNRLMHHGTLLYQTDLNVINQALIHYHQVAKGHQVLSNKQKVLNLKSLIDKDPQSLLEDLIQYIAKKMNINHQPLEKIDEVKINQIIQEKYQSWSWNFGHTPKFSIDVVIKGRPVELTVDKGIITQTQPKDFDYLLGERYYSEQYLMKI